jgi:hypothetical protein
MKEKRKVNWVEYRLKLSSVQLSIISGQAQSTEAI